MKNNKLVNNVNPVIHQLKEIYSVMVESGISEIELNTNIGKVKIKRYIKKEEKVEPTFKNLSETIQVKQSSLDNSQEISGETVDSPINGVFYRSPSPNSPPFVNEGDIVPAGSTLCIIEAMKIMNEIKADKKCKIIKILCENGSSVTVGTKLFVIQPL